MRLTALFIALILSFSIAYAETDNVLKVQQSTLNEKATPFLIQINATLSFAEKKGIDVSNLENLSEQFESKIKEALDANSKEEFKLKYDDAKYIAKKIKKEVKKTFKDYVDELKSEIKQKLEDKKDEIKAKVQKVDTKEDVIEAKVKSKIEDVKNILLNESKNINMTSENSTNTSINLPKIEKVKETSKSLWAAFLDHLSQIDKEG